MAGTVEARLVGNDSVPFFVVTELVVTAWGGGGGDREGI